MSAETKTETPAVPPAPAPKPGFKWSVRRVMAVFAGIGIADMAIGIARYPGPFNGVLNGIAQAFLGIDFNAVADVVQGVLGAISIIGFVATPIIYQDTKAA